MNHTNIEIKENYIPSTKDLLGLYENVGWTNYTNNPELLKNSYQHSLCVITAWDNDTLVGSIRVVGDGYSIIYIQDLLILQEYQHLGIGSKLLKRVLEKYHAVYQKVLLTEDSIKTKAFYEKLGFMPSDTYNCLSFVQFTM